MTDPRPEVGELAALRPYIELERDDTAARRNAATDKGETDVSVRLHVRWAALQWVLDLMDSIEGAAALAATKPSPTALNADTLAVALLTAFQREKWSVHPYSENVPWSWEQVAQAVLAALAPATAPTEPS